MWIFAYGSLIFRPSFAFVERRRAYVVGWSRRFWQGSPDHRGVPEAPGRVVTLVPDARAICGGCAYRIDPETAPETLAALDHREKAGFERTNVPVRDAPDGAPFAEAITYVADPTNPWFLGPLEERAIAELVRARRGPSGDNAEYAHRLHVSLRELEIADDHVEAIVAFLSASA